MAEIINLATFSLDTQKLQSNLDELQNTYFDLAKAQKDYANQSKETAKQIDALAKSQKALDSASGDNTEAMKANEKEMQSLVATQKELYKSEQNLGIQMSTVKKEINQTTNQIKAYQDAEGKTISLIDLGNQALTRQIKNKNDARAANIELNKVANQLNPSIAQEAELLKQLNSQVDKNTAFIKSNSSESGKQAMNIGNYKDSVVEAINETGLMNSTLSEMGLSGKVVEVGLRAISSSINETKTAMEQYKKAQEAGAVATELSSLSLKGFKIALISTGIGAIVVLLGSLISFLTTTQDGIDKLTGVLEPLKAIFSALGGLLTEVGGKLVATFQNPKKALNDLYEFMKNNIINRFTAFGVILDGIINLDFKKVANGVLQAGTGVQNLTDKIVNAAKESANFLADNIKKGQQVASLTKQIEEAQLRYKKAQVAVNDVIDEQLLISKDTSKSFKERADAAEKIIAITEKNGQAEKAILDLELQRLKLRQDIRGQQNLTLKDKNEEADLIAKIDDANDRGIAARIEQSKVLSGLKKEQALESEKLAKEEIDRALANSKYNIDLFITEQGFKKKSAQDAYDYNYQLYNKEYADLKLQLEKKVITQKEFDLKAQQLRVDYLAKNAELTVQNAELEYNAELEKNQKILDSDKYLSEEQLRIKQEALAADLAEEEKYQKARLENAVINQDEYDLAIEAAKEKNRLANEKLKEDRAVAEKDKKLVDFENERIANEAAFAVNLQDQQAQYDTKRAIEREQAIKQGADMVAFDEATAAQKKTIDQSVFDNKLQLASNTLSSLSAIFGEESKAGKAIAIAQTTMDTYKSATSAYAGMVQAIPGPIGIAAGIIAAAGSVAAGIANVKKITAVKEPTIKKPSYATGVIGLRGVGSGTSDNINANLSTGESIINARSTSMFANELSAINQAGGGVGLNGASNILNQNELSNNANNSQMASMIAEAVAVGAERGTSKGSEKGIVGLSNNRRVMQDAKF